MNINKARQGIEPLSVNSHNEINRNVIQHIATLVHYDCDDADIVARITPTATTPARWITFMATTIRNGTYVP